LTLTEESACQASVLRDICALRILESAEHTQLAAARELLATLRESLAEFGAPSQDRGTLAASIRQLDELFLVVVVGEFNAGKSAFINALLREAVLKEGVTPTTAEVHLLKFGADSRTETAADGLKVITAPVDLLRDVHIVDTPGTNAVIREHERITTEFVPRSDLVLFVTSADRPFTETERAFLATIRDWGKKIVIVVNKVDILGDHGHVTEVVAFVRDAARDLLGVNADVLPVSARLAFRAKHGEPSAWAASGFDALERYLSDTLDARTRFRLKLANPLGVGLALANRFATIAAERLTVTRDDRQLLDDIERQLALYREDLERGFELRLGAVEKILGEMEARGDRFFEDTLRLGRVADLLNRSRVQSEFEHNVVADVPLQIERRVSELIDWLVDQDFRQWQAVTARLADRQRAHAARVLGAPDVGTFHNDRSRLMDSVGRESQRVVQTYDKRAEGEAIADQARTAVAAAAAAGGAALSLGTIVTIAASSVAADITGILLASVVLGVGFLVIPARRRRAKATLQEKVATLRRQLATALRTEFERSRQRSAEQLADAIAPYARFVRAEDERWDAAHRALTEMGRRIEGLLSGIAPGPC
jgi:small GTP-binding protein